MANELSYWVALTQFPKIGPVRFNKLLNYFPDIAGAWRASFSELKKAGLEENIAEEFIIKRQEIEPDREWQKVEEENLKIITIKDAGYPKLLKEIYNAPYLLYYRGSLHDINNDFTIAVVGTRKISPYGRQVTEEIAARLAQNKITVISGLALGVDALAHLAALNNRGKTLAVLGSGADKNSVYPVANRCLAEKIIAEGGAIISEHPIGTPPLKHHFPARNRIIAGLSLGTLIVEAGEESGALITARCALEQNREVFAVPGNIYSKTSIGPNNLIKMGARAVTSAEDILETLNLENSEIFTANQKILADNPSEEKLLLYLSKEPKHIDELVRETKLNAAETASALTLMEMKGKVKNLGGMNYILAR
ncbi:MAG: DNA-processing protein DprA [Patescibacteria group bacterium]|nr:DNA-processing protein DprA [Patescibacteria group bacterium]MDD5490232.1 DNA-processing protein DprA [Patescibacteria group bacterium]